MLRLARALPRPVKALLVHTVESLGAWPQRIRAGPARGLVLTAPLTRWSQYAGGRHEAHVAEILSSLLEPGMVTYDAGAHFGYLSLVMAARVGGSGRVFSFEPVASHASLLRRTVARNRLSQVTVVERALGAGVADAWMIDGATDAMGQVVEGRVSGGRTVAVTTLDAWASSLGEASPPDLIKLDVEGRELDVLTGGAELVRRHQPVIVCEVHWSRGIPYRPRQLVDWLKAAGYRVSLLAHPHDQDPDLEGVLRITEQAEAPEHMVVFHVLAVGFHFSTVERSFSNEPS